MTQGGPLRSTTSLVLLMYEEGFRWWRMGYAAAVAFVLFLVILAAMLVQRRVQREASCEAPSGRGRRSTRRSSPGRSSRSGRCCGWSPPRSCRRARPTPIRRGCCPSAPTLEHYETLFTRLDLGRNLVNSAIIAATVTVLSLFINSMAGYALAKLRFRYRERVFRTLSAGLLLPVQIVDAAALPAVQGAGPGQQLLGRDRPVAGEHLRHLPDPAVRPRPCPTTCSTRPGSTARASCGSTGRSCCR